MNYNAGESNSNYKHGYNKTLTHRIWKGVRARCNCKTNSRYQYYGGRGITVCKRWDDFMNFLSDMGECPDGFSIDRKDNSKGYTPENCYWATKKQQASNRRSNLIIEYKSRKQSLQQWCDELGLKYTRIRDRLRLGWSVVGAFENIKIKSN